MLRKSTVPQNASDQEKSALIAEERKASAESDFVSLSE